jgi:phage terminase small subunit
MSKGSAESIQDLAKALTKKQRAFADAYLSDPALNGTRAYLTAYPGTSEKAANSGASRQLTNAKVAAYIAASMEKRSKATDIDAQYVLRRLVEIDQMDVVDILEDDGRVKPIKDCVSTCREWTFRRS